MPQTFIGSILDQAFLEEIRLDAGYDAVHAWGVLHPTGCMNQGIRNAADFNRRACRPGVMNLCLKNYPPATAGYPVDPVGKIVRRGTG